MLALKLRAPEPEPSEILVCDEYWVGDVEPCGDDWTFSVIGPDEETETFVCASQTDAECARARMLRMLCPAIAVTISQH
jgi:hypothetical protein